MKEIIRKPFSLVLVCIMCLSMCFGINNMKAEATVDGGSCGENLVWTFDSSTGELAISGSGDMDDWEYHTKVPWGKYYNYISKITIGSEVTSIGGESFRGCRGITEIEIPDSITKIGNYSFFYCENLKSLRIPEKVEYIGDCAFGNCKNLIEVLIPKSIKKMGIVPFLYCDKLERIVVDEENADFSSDEHGVLFNKDKTDVLQYPTGKVNEKYTIPNTVNSISYMAFSGCKLIEVIVPDSVTKIEQGAFELSEKIVKIYIGSGVEDLNDSSIFSSCKSLSEIIVSENNKYFSSDGHGVLFNKNQTILHKYPYGKTDLTYTVPDGVIEIDGTAFKGNRSIEKVFIPESTLKIGRYAFGECIGLLSVNIEEGLETIGQDAFSGCEKLEDINFPQSIRTIDGYAFYRCANLMKIDLPDGLTHIGQEVFQGTAYCSNADNWEDGVMYIGRYLISGYNKEGEYAVKDGTRVIAEGAFNYATKLTDITFPDSLSVIDKEAFSFCTSLNNVTFPESLTTIGSLAFEHCESFTELALPENIETVGDHAFYHCDNLKKVSIPKNIKYIEDAAFYSCKKIKEAKYDGTKEEWKNVTVGEGNECLTKALKFEGETSFFANLLNSIKSFVNTFFGIFKNIFG